MSWRTWSYIWVVLLIAVAVIGSALDIPRLSTYQWLTFSVLTILTATTHSFEAILGRQSYYPHMSLFFANLLLLPPILFIAVVTIPRLIEWGKKRLQDSQYLRNWYLQPFNVAVHIIAGAGAYGVLATLEAETLLGLTQGRVWSS